MALGVRDQVCVCVQTGRIKDLKDLHCTSGSGENNGVVLLLFFISLVMIIQVYASQRNLAGPGYHHSQASGVKTSCVCIAPDA